LQARAIGEEGRTDLERRNHRPKKKKTIDRRKEGKKSWGRKPILAIAVSGLENDEAETLATQENQGEKNVYAETAPEVNKSSKDLKTDGSHIDARSKLGH